jgi:hypothetical protein
MKGAIMGSDKTTRADYQVVIPDWDGLEVDENGKAIIGPLRDPKKNWRTRHSSKSDQLADGFDDDSWL